MLNFKSVIVLGGFAAGALAMAPPVRAEAPRYYVATLATPSPATGAAPIIGHVVWHNDGASWFAARTEARDEILCAQVAAKLGRLAGFVVGGAPFDAAKLDRCNKAAR